jgi:two-component system, chemotaxis family, protein-glutamate methylesterase/glutaminase
MPTRILVIGGSSGSIEPLVEVVGGLRSNFAAAVFVVMHMPPWAKSKLPEILSRGGPLCAIHPTAQQRIETGVVYVAPPDFHMVIKESHVELWRGPREDRHRRSINALFRSAAVEFGERAIGTILSGSLDDGATGIYWIKDYGGVTIVQDPETAKFPSMPAAALENAQIDYVLKSSEIAPLVVELFHAPSAPHEILSKKPG